MAQLTAKTRRAIPTSQFALPGRRAYPIHNKSHARNALARVSQHGTPAERVTVRAAVHRRFPSISISGGKTGRTAHLSTMLRAKRAMEPAR